MELIRKFINDNKLSFAPGSRNTTVTTLIGYSQHLGISRTDLAIAIKPEIDADSFIAEEIDRLWDYCERNHYKNYWTKAEAVKQYTF